MHFEENQRVIRCRIFRARNNLRKTAKFSKTFKNIKFQNICYFGDFWGHVVIFGNVPDVICYSLGLNNKNWAQIKWILKIVNFYLKHPRHTLWIAQICPRAWESQPNDTHPKRTLISLLAKLILARSPLGLRAKIVIYVSFHKDA